MAARGVFSSWEASDTKRRRAFSVVWSRSVRLLNSSPIRPVAVRALPHLADGGQELPDLLRQRHGQHQAQCQYHHADHSGQFQQVFLEAFQQRRLLRIVFIGVHRTNDLILIQYRRGRPAAESAIMISAGKRVVAHQGLDDLRVQDIPPHSAAGLAGIIKGLSGAVRHQNTAQARLLHHRHGGRHVLLVQLVQAGQGVDHDGHAALHGGLLGAEHHVLGHQQRVGVQQDQHRRDDEDVAQAEFGLKAAPQPWLIL